ncbi:MAG: ribonuclease H-like domain-containing protein [Acidobacteria bacterium]|nr:ribonuclease H-like domain-containing protein [Acidobacteriota bacterium]
MSNIPEQLAELRQRVAGINRKYEDGPPPQPVVATRRPARYFVEEWLSGQEIQTPHGAHFETERLYERHKRHGSLDIGDLAELPHDLLDAISQGTVPAHSPEKWAFLDTETTGLAGGSGTYAFLIGVGRITPEGFRVRQFFMREHGEEASLLSALADHLAGFEVLITYNGKTYDQPLLETRYRMSRFRPPFDRMPHLDLLHGARRLWKLRFDSCRLVELENQILGVEREGDLPGEMIPYVYFEYLRTGEAYQLVPILHHNAIDILTLACLTGVVPWAFRSPEQARLSHGAEMVGLGRWFRQADQPERALELFRRAVGLGLKDELMFRTLWDISLLERKAGRDDAALAVLTDLAAERNPYRVPALEELAKHYEHREKNYPMALEMTRAALGYADTPALRKREARLARRGSGPRPRRLL